MLLKRIIGIATLICLLSSTCPMLTVYGESIDANHNQVESPMYLRSFYVQIRYPSSRAVIFYQDAKGYRGYLSLIDGIAMDVDGVTLRLYHGVLYHPSVKGIPMPAH